MIMRGASRISFSPLKTTFHSLFIQGVDSDEDDEDGDGEDVGDQNCDEEEYQLELAHGYVKKGEKPKWDF